ncbi:MAG: ABC transporter permease [Cytophagia bacterium]|nr:MAG: ABC transporter permease [Cytophagales bacterium]TAG38691.1 MAG: ABC transporter permease [Cytophagia bacterium]
MIRNYLKIAFRNILKNKALFGINVFGLAIGLATFLTITLFVVDELSYDKFNDENIVRVILSAKMGEEKIDEAAVMAPVAATLKQTIPEVKQTTRLYKLSDAAKVVLPNKSFRNGKLAFADDTFFDVFSLKMVQGNPKTALQKPFSVVLTQAQAQTYFGNADPINKSIEIKEIGVWSEGGYSSFEGQYTVTGIIENMPSNAHFHFDLLASMSTNTTANAQTWLSGQYHTYLKLHKVEDLKSLERKIKSATDGYFSAGLKSDMGLSLNEFKAKGNNVGLFLQPLYDIHLHSNLRGELEAGGNFKTVLIFSTIAIFMLLIACINFINLSTASASNRLKEIGMRKVLGSAKQQLVFQFLTESFLSTIFSLIIGVLLFYVSLPLFNQLSGKSFQIQQLLSVENLLLLPCLIVVIGLLAGGYPAFFMSSFNPLGALKNRFTTGKSKGVRSTLVVFQFAISVILIIGALIVHQQMEFIEKKDVGYNRNSLIVIREAGFLGDKLNVFKEELQKNPQIKSITTSAFVPAGPTDQNMMAALKANDRTQRIRTRVYNIDEAYVPTLGMKILLGRNFSQALDPKSTNILINETAIKALGLPQNPIGKTIRFSDDTDKTIVGVVKDFHARSLREPIEPLVMEYKPYFGLILKAENKDIATLLKNMESIWNTYGTGETFSYAFLDELYNETYLKETNMFIILRAFALLTIFIASLGLFGLITYTTQQRIKEIGIRKVLGSTVLQIVVLLSKDFLKLVGISLLIAFPAGYYVMNNWLQDFEYRTELNGWVFLIAGFSTITIALLTISFRSIKAALMNPVKSLKTE